MCSEIYLEASRRQEKRRLRLVQRDMAFEHIAALVHRAPARAWTGLLGGATYTRNQASYDLARLRTNGLITRMPGKNRYRLTGDGLRFAIFYTKLHDRLLRPLLATDQPPAPPPLRKALHTIDIHITETIDQARLLPNAA